MQIIGIKNVRDIATDKFSVSQRGILITLFILEEEDSKLTLAKFKAQIKLADYRDDLIYLHEKGFIKWSGYKSALKDKENSEENQNAIEAVRYFNDLCGTGCKYDSKSIYPSLVARLKEAGLDDVKRVIANRYAVWKDDKVMSKHLKLETILRLKNFPKYLEEVQRTNVGESFLNATKLGLKDGDTITFELSHDLIDNDVYSIIYFKLNEKGERIGNGQSLKDYGRDLKRKLKIQHNQLEFSPKDYEIVYKKE